MALKIGIVGLPNVGKSTLFNALTRSAQAQTANYPFCTIEPNTGMVCVPDERLEKLAQLVHPAKVTPAMIEFVDIAGLVKGASEGAGLGNQFLANIRECEAIAIILRFFDDPNVMHVDNKVDPKADREILEAELILADLQTLEKRLLKTKSEAKSGDKEKQEYFKILETLKTTLESGNLANQTLWNEKERESLRDLHLLTMKPLLYVANVSEDQIQNLSEEDLRNRAEIEQQYAIIAISAKIESELLGLAEKEEQEYLQTLGLKEPALHHLIREAYRVLGLQTFFTAGPKEVRAWTMKKGSMAPQAAGVIHTDFEKGFIRAEVTNFDDFIAHNGEQGAKEHGLMRQEGKSYIMQDSDVVYFRFNL